MVPPRDNERIPFFTDRSLMLHDKRSLEAAIAGIVQRGVFVEGPLAAELERRLAAYTGADHAIAVGNASDALILALLALGIKPGDEVLVPAFTFVASATAVTNIGATPVFVDIDPRTYNTTAELMRAALTPRTRAIMPVHLFSQMAEMAPLMELAAKHGLAVVEDSAEGIGMFQRGVHAGLHGEVGVLSFFPTKTLAGLGDGGLVITRNPEVAAYVRSMRAYGRDPGRAFHWIHCGINSKLDEIQAAILLARLDRLPVAIARRRHLARCYDTLLAPLAPELTLPTLVAGCVDEPVFYVYLIECEARDALVAHLARAGIETETYYPRPLHLQPAFAHLGYRLGSLPNAERATRRTVALPLYPDLTEVDVGRVCAAVTAFVRGGQR